MSAFRLDSARLSARLTFDMNDNSPMIPPDHVPSESECLKMGDICYYGLEGHAVDYELYAEWMQRGHELGYLNCTSELCDCYAMGYGVPRDSARALELARELEAKGSPLGWKFLAMAHASGQGVPLDTAKARAYGRRLLEALSRPVPGVDEERRYEALIAVYALPGEGMGKGYEEAYVRTARRCMLESQLQERYACYATALMNRLPNCAAEDEAEERLALLQEITSYLEKGVAQGDGMSMYCLAVILGIGGASQERIRELLAQASRRGHACVLGDLLRLCSLTDEEVERVDVAFWYSCNYGISLKSRPEALPCLIRLVYSPFACEWNVHREPGADRAPLPTRLALYNLGEEELSQLHLRLCSADAGVDYHCDLEGSIAPGEAMELPLSEYEQKAGRELGTSLLVELQSGERRAEMLLDHTLGLPYFYRKVDASALPLELWWERSLLGGVVLCVRCTEGCVKGLSLFRNRSGKWTMPRNLAAGEVARFGRREFRSLRALALGEELGLLAEEIPLLLLNLCS